MVVAVTAIVVVTAVVTATLTLRDGEVTCDIYRLHARCETGYLIARISQ